MQAGLLQWLSQERNIDCTPDHLLSVVNALDCVGASPQEWIGRLDDLDAEELPVFIEDAVASR